MQPANPPGSALVLGPDGARLLEGDEFAPGVADAFVEDTIAVLRRGNGDGGGLKATRDPPGLELSPFGADQKIWWFPPEEERTFESVASSIRAPSGEFRRFYVDILYRELLRLLNVEGAVGWPTRFDPSILYGISAYSAEGLKAAAVDDLPLLIKKLFVVDFAQIDTLFHALPTPGAAAALGTLETAFGIPGPAPAAAAGIIAPPAPTPLWSTVVPTAVPTFPTYVPPGFLPREATLQRDFVRFAKAVLRVPGRVIGPATSDVLKTIPPDPLLTAKGITRSVGRIFADEIWRGVLGRESGAGMGPLGAVSIVLMKRIAVGVTLGIYARIFGTGAFVRELGLLGGGRGDANR